jgi:hypothetical protein
VEPYFAALTTVWESRSYKIAEYIVEGLYPSALASTELRDRTRAWLDANPEVPALRRMLVEALAGVERALAAQARDAAAEVDGGHQVPAVQRGGILDNLVQVRDREESDGLGRARRGCRHCGPQDSRRRRGGRRCQGRGREVPCFAGIDEVRAYGDGASAGGVELEDAGAVEASGGELRLCRDAAEAGRVSAVYNGGHYRQAARRGDLAVDHAVPGHPRGEVRGVALLRLNVLL